MTNRVTLLRSNVSVIIELNAKLKSCSISNLSDRSIDLQAVNRPLLDRTSTAATCGWRAVTRRRRRSRRRWGCARRSARAGRRGPRRCGAGGRPWPGSPPPPRPTPRGTPRRRGPARAPRTPPSPPPLSAPPAPPAPPPSSPSPCTAASLPPSPLASTDAAGGGGTTGGRRTAVGARRLPRREQSGRRRGSRWMATPLLLITDCLIGSSTICLKSHF